VGGKLIEEMEEEDELKYWIDLNDEQQQEEGRCGKWIN
jgi:hypothetical protein